MKLREFRRGQFLFLALFLGTLFARNLQADGTTLPFVPTGIIVSPHRDLAVIWNRAAPVSPTRRFDAPRSAPQQIAVVKLSSGEVLATKPTSAAVEHAAIAGDYVAIAFAGGDLRRCDFLQLSDLKVAKGIVGQSPITRLKAVGDLTFIESKTDVLVISNSTLEHQSRFLNSRLTQFGVVTERQLVDYSLHPKLLFNPDPLPAIDSATILPTLLKEGIDKEYDLSSYPPKPVDDWLIAGKNVPGKDVAVVLYGHLINGSPTESTREYSIDLVMSNAYDKRYSLLSATSQESAQAIRSKTDMLLEVDESNAYVVIHDKLFVWQLPPTPPTFQETEPLAWLPTQSLLALPDADLKRVLFSCRIRGGKSPKTFALASPLNGMRIDRNSGQVTIEIETILAQSTDFLVKRYASLPPEKSAVETFRTEAERFMKVAPYLTAQPATGFPVAFPIEIIGSDAKLDSDRLKVFVVAEVPLQGMTERLKKLDDARMDGRPANSPSSRPADSSNEEAELAAMKRRIAELEMRVETLTRQMNLLLKAKQ